MIPQIIHFCWLSGDAYPPLIKKCMDSWKKYLPDYEFMLWDKDRLDSLHSQWASQAFDCKKYAFAADYIRCYAVYHFGGIYLDTDVEVCKSLDDYLMNNSFIGFDSRGDLEAAVFGAEKNALWLKKALNFYDGRSFVNETGGFNITTMPNIFKTALEKELLLVKNRHIINKDSTISLYPCDYFSPKDYTNGIVRKTNNTVTIHHFNAAWLKEDRRLMLRHQLKLLIAKFLGLRVVDFMTRPLIWK